MSSPVLLIEKSDAVASVTLNRPAAMNALSLELRQALTQGFRELAQDAAVRVVILAGAGRAFCAGLDLGELGSREGQPLGAFSDGDMIGAIRGFPGPVIGAVNGFAITGGFELALACDLLIASSEARFADTHARVGILPGWGLSQKLPRLIGIGRAKELAFTGQLHRRAAGPRLGAREPRGGAGRAAPGVPEARGRHALVRSRVAARLQAADRRRLRDDLRRGPAPRGARLARSREGDHPRDGGEAARGGAGAGSPPDGRLTRCGTRS